MNENTTPKQKRTLETIAMPKQPLPVSPKQVSHMGVGSKYDEFGKELPCKSIKEELACILGEVGEVEKNNDKKEGDPTSTVAGNSDEKVVIEIQIGAELSEKPSTKRKLGFLDDVDDIDIATGICPEFQTCKYCNVPIRTITWASHINCEWHRYHVEQAEKCQACDQPVENTSRYLACEGCGSLAHQECQKSPYTCQTCQKVDMHSMINFRDVRLAQIKNLVEEKGDFEQTTFETDFKKIRERLGVLRKRMPGQLCSFPTQTCDICKFSHLQGKDTPSPKFHSYKLFQVSCTRCKKHGHPGCLGISLVDSSPGKYCYSCVKEDQRKNSMLRPISQALEYGIGRMQKKLLRSFYSFFVQTADKKTLRDDEWVSLIKLIQQEVEIYHVLAQDLYSSLQEEQTIKKTLSENHIKFFKLCYEQAYLFTNGFNSTRFERCLNLAGTRNLCTIPSLVTAVIIKKGAVCKQLHEHLQIWSEFISDTGQNVNMTWCKTLGPSTQKICHRSKKKASKCSKECKKKKRLEERTIQANDRGLELLLLSKRKAISPERFSSIPPIKMRKGYNPTPSPSPSFKMSIDSDDKTVE